MRLGSSYLKHAHCKQEAGPTARNTSAETCVHPGRARLDSDECWAVKWLTARPRLVLNSNITCLHMGTITLKQPAYIKLGFFFCLFGSYHCLDILHALLPAAHWDLSPKRGFE